MSEIPQFELDCDARLLYYGFQQVAEQARIADSAVAEYDFYELDPLKKRAFKEHRSVRMHLQAARVFAEANAAGLYMLAADENQRRHEDALETIQVDIPQTLSA